MLKFDTLSRAQKRFVIAVIEHSPQYKTDPTITLKECAAIYYDLRDQREGKKGEKIGYPNWLFAKNKIARGQYQLPIPTETELSSFARDESIRSNPVKAAKAKVASLAAKTIVTVDPEENRLQKIIDESLEVEDYDFNNDFNDICREAGIDVGMDTSDYY